MADRATLLKISLPLTTWGFIVGMACAQPVLAAALSEPDSDSPMVSVTSNDAEVNAAIAEARKTLPYFWKVF